MQEGEFKPVAGHFRITYAEANIDLIIHSGSVGEGSELLETFRTADILPTTQESAIILLFHQQQAERTRFRWNDDNRAKTDIETRTRYPLLSSLLPESILAAGSIGITIRSLTRLGFSPEKLAQTDNHQLRASGKLGKQRLPLAAALREIAQSKLTPIREDIAI